MAITREFLLLQLAPLDEVGPVRRVRGVAVAAALEWLEVLPDGPLRDKALCGLLAVTEDACAALAGG